MNMCPRSGGLVCLVLLITTLASAVAGGSTAASDAARQGQDRRLKKPAPSAVYRIASLRAYLYYHEIGKFGDADILTAKVALRNIFIGEGDDGTPSGAMLILADLEGPGFARGVSQALYLNVVAREGARELGSARLRVREFWSGAGRVSLPVLIYGTRCEPVRIVAKLEGVPDTAEVSATAPFSCGE